MDDRNQAFEHQDHPGRPPKQWRPISYTRSYVPDDQEAFQQRLRDLYAIAKASIKYRHMAKWAKCCKTAERQHVVGTLGHPDKECISFKDLLHSEKLHSEETFREYMMATLPRNEKWHILLPQVNMRHINIKLEEGEEPDYSEAQLPLKREDEDPRVERLQEELQSLQVQNERLTAEVAGLKAELRASKVA